MPTPVAIPQDLAACQTLIVEMAGVISTLNAANQQMEQTTEELLLTIQRLQAMMFGRRTERYVEDPGQQHFAFPDDGGLAAAQMAAALEQANAIIQEYLVRRRKKQAAKKPPEGSQKLPEHLERREFPVEVPVGEQACETHGPRARIGEERVEVLEFDRPKLWVRVLVYPKYACVGHGECGVRMPERVIAGMVPGGKYAPSVAAEVVVNKYIRHLPLYRQQDLYAGLGWVPSRSTLCGINETTTSLLEPLARRYAALLLQDQVLGTDDTRALLLRSGEDPGSQKAYFWLYRGCGTVPYNVYDFTTNREQTGPQQFLRNYRGTFVADCYAGYVNVAQWSNGQAVHAGCWGHAHRKVFDARESSPIEAAVLLGMCKRHPAAYAAGPPVARPTVGPTAVVTPIRVSRRLADRQPSLVTLQPDLVECRAVPRGGLPWPSPGPAVPPGDTPGSPRDDFSPRRPEPETRSRSSPPRARRAPP